MTDDGSMVLRLRNSRLMVGLRLTRLCEPVATVAFVDISAGDRHAGQPLDLCDLILQRMAVVWKTRDGADADDELTAIGARVGDSDRDFHSELIARARLALCDAFDLGRMQGVNLIFVIGLLRGIV